MKSIIAALFLTVTSFAMANDDSVFMGRYRVEAGRGCMKDPGARTYVTKGTYTRGMPSVRLQFYSEDAVLVDVPTLNGSVQTPGSSSQFMDKVTILWPNSSTLIASIRTTGKSYGQAVNTVTEYALSVKGTRLVYAAKENGRMVEYCTLTKY
ncbi:MAG TPA: hypothetical protein VNJ01_18335 [Bacteriovoracaceae bacterium]|nr:hypothetical protein [Bacteriovoracaceae bacterium]